jgi:molybdate transport system substrate-binding protein
MRWLRPMVPVLFLGALSGCSEPARTAHEPGAQANGGKGDKSGAHKAQARIYAAASLTDVIAALGRQFEPIRGSHLVPSYGASNTLAQQIHEGAPAGVFISASAEWVDELVAWGHVEEGTRVDLLSNALVVVVPKGAAGRPAKLADLTGDGVKRVALADPGHVPAGKYAKAALEKAGVFETLRARVVAANDVRTALAYVERGEADAGIVYATDAAVSSKVDVAFRVPAELHPKIVYPMVLVKRANRRARELYDFLRSDAAWAEFEKAGFAKP